jgi:hypothetical protein
MIIDNIQFYSLWSTDMTIDFKCFLCREATHDKVYYIWIEELESLGQSPNRYTVPFKFGRRGNFLKEGDKVSSPVSLEQAQKEFNKMVRDKQNPRKGYVAFNSEEEMNFYNGLVFA